MSRWSRVLLLVLLAQSALGANRISVERPTVRVGETFRVVIALEGAAAEADRLPIPLTNLELLGSPSVSRQFSLIDGHFTRTKVLEYTARPLGQGRAIIGPIRLVLEGRQIEIPGAAVEVLAATAPGGESPAAALRQMARESREPVFVTVEGDRDRAVVGQQIVVTWTVWAREEMTEPSIIDLPSLEGFWSEEIPVAGQITNTVEEGDVLARAVVRKVALFPMRSGELEVGPLEIRAGMYQRLDPFGFGVLFRGGFVNVNRSSPPLTIRVAPVPREADVVGDFEMSCSRPIARGGGPVSFVVTIAGEGSLRLAPAPRFESAPAAEVQVEPGDLDVRRSGEGLRMKRSWTVLLVPRGRGAQAIPALSMRAWNPVAGRLEVLRCDPGPASIESIERSRPIAPPSAARRPSDEAPRRAVLWPLIVAGVLVILGGAAWLLLARRREKLRPQEERILRHHETPRLMKEEVKEMLRGKAIDSALLYGAGTPLADAYRALWSLLDVLEKEPWERERSSDDLVRRVREFVGRMQ